MEVWRNQPEVVRRHSLQLVRMVAFCVDILSPGRPSLFHWATVASSVSMEAGSKPSVIGIGIWRREKELYITNA